VLERGPKTSGELAVGHKDHSNHQQSIVSGAAAAPENRQSHRGRIFVQCGAMFKQNPQKIPRRR
jgi:hypothetical protein